MADGSVSGNQIGLCLSTLDREHLVRFRSFLGSSHPIADLSSQNLVHPRTSITYTCKPTSRITFFCKPLATALRRLGLNADKSHGAEVVGLEFDRDFWRGVIDGDGSVGIYPDRKGNPYPCLQLLGSKPLMLQYRSFLQTLLPDYQPKMIEADSIWHLGTSGTRAASVIRHLYEACEVALPRKLARAEEVMRWQPIDPSIVPGRFKHVTREMLLEMHARHGTWRGVARELKIQPGNLPRLLQSRGIR